MTIPKPQLAAARYLANLANGPPRETQISAVFIGTDTVWKLKKAVSLPFLDFSTLAAREHFLRREFDLNQPAAPGIYRDVIAIARQPDGTLGLGSGTPIDWVLRMAPVPAADFLDVIASDGALTPERLDALGDCVASFHAGLTPLTDQDGADGQRRIAEGNARSAVVAGLPRADVEAWHRRMTAAIDSRQDWLRQRSADGYIRRCHGDLHLGNLCLWERRPVPFDALEFDEQLAIIDTAYDLAFLLMDLDHRVGRQAANRVMNRYVARTDDIAAQGFPIFLAQRAMVRAHVLNASGQDGGAYLAAAQRYLDPASPPVIAIGGLQGTGKSTLARALAADLGAAPGALVVRSDEIRKRLHHADPETRLESEAYTPAANIDTNRGVIERACTAAVAGQSVIVDATFLDLTMRKTLATAIGQAGVPFLGIWLQASLSVLEARIRSRQGDASDATVSVLHQAARDDPGPGDWLPVDTNDGERALPTVRLAAGSRRRGS